MDRLSKDLKILLNESSVPNFHKDVLNDRHLRMISDLEEYMRENQLGPAMTVATLLDFLKEKSNG